MPIAAGMGTALPTSLDEFSKGPFGFSDADAAKRLLYRVSRDIAEVLDAGDKGYADDLLPIYRWLGAVIAEEEVNIHNQEPD